MSGHTRESVRILSASPGIELDVWLYSPISPAPFPVVVAGHGLSLVKDAGLAAFGEEWASRAHFASLILDYRHFGESGGEPRNLISLEKQLQDYQSVIDWARARPEKFRVDKIVVMGSALSGLHVAELLLRDQRLAGGMAHCPVLDGYATSIAGPVNVRLMFWAFVDYVKGKLGLHPVFIAAVGHPGDLAFLSAPSCYLGFENMWAQGSTSFYESPNLVAPRLVFDILSSRPGRRLKEAQSPMLVVMPESDDMIPAAVTRDIIANSNQKIRMVVSPGNHFDVMRGGKGYETNIQAQIEFLRGLV